MSARSAEAAIREFWPDHATCLGQHDPVEDKVEGIVCPCGTILGFPEMDEPADPDASLFDQQGPIPAGFSAPDGSYVSGLDDPDDWPAQAAEDATVAEQSRQRTAVVVQSPQPEGSHGAVSSVEAEDPITSALMVIDPTMPYTPAEIESQLIDIAARLERGVHFQRGWEEQNYRDRLAFELAYNRTIMESHESSADRRKAEAITKNSKQFEAKALSDMMVKAVRETMHNLRSLQSGFQTISNSVKASTESYRR